MITYLEPDILECEVRWALGSISMNKASGDDGISIELFQILKDDAVKVLKSICQQIWKTQQCSLDFTNQCLLNYGRRFVTLYRRQRSKHLHGKEMLKTKMAVGGGLTNS